MIFFSRDGIQRDDYRLTRGDVIDIHFGDLNIHQQIGKIVHAEGLCPHRNLIAGYWHGLCDRPAKRSRNKSHVKSGLGGIHTRRAADKSSVFGTVLQTIIGTLGILKLSLRQCQVGICSGNIGGVRVGAIGS